MLKVLSEHLLSSLSVVCQSFVMVNKTLSFTMSQLKEETFHSFDLFLKDSCVTF